MSASSPDDVWIVGYTGTPEGTVPGLVMHRDGATWTEVPTPRSEGGYDTFLYAVFAIAPDDVWVLGDDGGQLVFHWDGASWTRMPVPKRPFFRLHSLEVVGPDDVWGVGSWTPQTGPFRYDHHPLIAHYDGTSWTVVPQPVTGPGDLIGSALGPDGTVWAAGSQRIGPGRYGSLIQRWDGTAWQVVPAPGSAGVTYTLNDIEAVGPDDAWAVGATRQAYGHPVFLHWDGESWTDADPPHARWRGALTSLDLTSRGVLWALGYRVKEVKVELGSETRAWTVLNRLGTAGWRPVAGLQGWILEEIDDAGDGVAYAVGRQAGRSDLVAVRCPADAPSPRSGR